MLLKAAVVVKAFIDHTDRNDGVDQPKVPCDVEIGCKNQGDAVTHSKDGHKLHNVFEGA